LIYDNQAREAIDNLRDYLRRPNALIQSGQDITIVLLNKASKLYQLNIERFMAENSEVIGAKLMLA
jgi:hypothetical protein